MASFALFFAAYLLFAGQVSAVELGAAAVCGLLASIWSALVARTAPAHFGFAPGMFMALLRGLGQIPSGSSRVVLAAVRAAGRDDVSVVQRPFFRGAADAPGDRTRRAIGICARSIAPDSIVLRIDPDRDDMLVHVMGEDAPENPRWPI